MFTNPFTSGALTLGERQHHVDVRGCVTMNFDCRQMLEVSQIGETMDLGVPPRTAGPTTQ